MLVFMRCNVILAFRPQLLSLPHSPKHSHPLAHPPTTQLTLPPTPASSSLAYQPPEELARTLDVVRRARVTVVSLPLVNQWTQDRDHSARRTPRWRGVTLLHELRAAGVPTAIASDNTRDQVGGTGWRLCSSTRAGCGSSGSSGGGSSAAGRR